MSPATATTEPDEDPPRNPIWATWVRRRAEVGVLAEQTPGELVGVTLRDQIGACLEQRRESDGRRVGLLVRRSPGRAARTSAPARDVVEILGNEREAAQRSVVRAANPHVVVGERVQWILGPNERFSHLGSVLAWP